MKRTVLILLLVFLTSSSVSAGIFFNRRSSKVKPEERVPQLLVIVKTDGDEHKRASAAEELRNYDPVAFPALVPVLIDVLLTDKRSAVRAEAAQSLGRLRPVYADVGRALEHAVANDPSLRVRLQARSSLLQYQWAGYRKGNKGKGVQTTEPPLAGPISPTPPRVSNPPTVKTQEPAEPAHSRWGFSSFRPFAAFRKGSNKETPRPNQRLAPRPTAEPPLLLRPVPMRPNPRPNHTQEPPLVPPTDEGPILGPPPG
jgi:hypothetical protein